jgi:hypothetical protein
MDLFGEYAARRSTGNEILCDRAVVPGFVPGVFVTGT